VATEDSLTPYQLRPLAKLLTLQMVKRFKGNYGDIRYLPTNFVIDRKGILRYAESGGFTREGLDQVLGLAAGRRRQSQDQRGPIITVASQQLP
jgi:cytochrome c biogenesis protein CcmG, thiol:disulfide interchange protein DsbE